VLSIGRLSPGAADYYIGEVASSAEDYYTGHGEAAGRWVGSLADSLGLRGEVKATHFRSVLGGRHPFTDAQLVQRPGCAARPAPNPDQPRLFQDDEFDLARVAARLKVGVRRVRQLVWAGERRHGTPDRYLVGHRATPGGRGRPSWRVARSEVERYEAANLGRKGRPGFDLTLRPPKSVSVLWALAPDHVRNEIRRAHSEAVDAVVAHLETHALYSRRRIGRVQEAIDTDGLVAAAFDHRTSRAGDPLLHTHVVVANLTHSVDGKWRALDGRPLFDHARPAGVLYQAHLRHLLTIRLGVRWEDVKNGWAEIVGVPKPVVRAFSKRRKEIEELVAEAGYTSADAHQIATLATRRPKDHSISPDALAQRWRQEAAERGFGPVEVAACLGHDEPNPAHVDLDAHFPVLAGPDGLTKHTSTFTRKEVVEALGELVGASASAAEIDAAVDRFLASRHVVALCHSRRAREWVWRRSGTRERQLDLVSWSTPELIKMESDILRRAAATDDRRPFPHDTTVDDSLARRPGLSPEQRHMVTALAANDAPFIQCVAGRPGAGKTTATAAYIEILAKAGIPVVGCAVAATAAGELERACEFGQRTGREASTVARLLIDIERSPLEPGTVVVVDEASMLSTRDLHRLSAHVASIGGSVKLIGDPDQHGAVDSGGAFRTLVDHLPAVHLVENNRQTRLGDRDAIEHFRHGNVEAALARYDEAGDVVRSPDAQTSYARIVEDWWKHAENGAAAPMIASRNAVRRDLNRMARARMTDAGQLSGDEIDNADGTSLAVGDWVVTRRNHRGLRSDRGGWVKNGAAGRVISTDARRQAVTVRFDREGDIRLPRSYIDAGHLQHGYARTTYGVQGATLDHAFVHLDDHTAFEDGYVAITRGRRSTTLYLVDGTAAVDDDTTHRAHEQLDTGLDTVARTMEHRRASSLAHDDDPAAGQVLAAFNGWSLDRLYRERRSLETLLRDAPHDPVQDLRTAVENHDHLLVQNRSHSARPGRITRRIERSLARVDSRLERLRADQAERREFVEMHAAEFERLELICRAELTREATVRALARTNRLEMDLGEDRDPLQAKSEIDAAELVAIHVERFGCRTDRPPSDHVEALLGAEPFGGGDERDSYERAAAALRAALDLRDETPARFDEVPDIAEPELFP
jgi:conjugative relaxase-like TrwC/TraI family protein